MEKAYIFLADGFEEIEGLTVVDILRRAGVEIQMVSIMGRKELTGSHGIPVVADAVFEEVDFSDGTLFVLPGGMPGTTNLLEHEGLMHEIRKAAGEGKWVCAICAAPMVLAAAGVLDGRQATIYPGMENYIACAKASSQPVVRDGNIITSKAPGTAMKFALALVEALYGREKAERIGKDELRS